MSGNVYFIGIGLGNGAITEYFRVLANKLVDRGNQVILLPWGMGSNESGFTYKNIVVHPWPSPRPTHLKDALFLFRLIKKYKPQCVIGNFGAVNLMMVVGWLTHVPCRISWYRTLRRQISLDWQGSKKLMQFLMFRKRLVYRLSTHIACNSQASIDDIVATFGVPKNKCMLFMNSLCDPIDHYFNRTHTGEGLVICAGRFMMSKGQDVLLDAVEKTIGQVKKIKIRFLGTGPTFGDCVKRAMELGIGDICEFVGSVSHAEVLRNMEMAIVTIVPSRDEAFGLVALESMAVGTPVIASNVGGLGEIVRDGVDGFLVKPEDPELLAKKLIILLNDTVLREKMGLSARSRFLEAFEQKSVVRAHADRLERIVSEITNT